MNRTLVLDHNKIEKKIHRIACQIHENNFQEEELLILGIKSRGSELAKRLVKILKDITEINITFYEIELNKEKPLTDGIVCTLEKSNVEGKVAILVDDVLNTGKVLMFAAKYLLDFNLKSLQTVVLVDRRHRSFPIRADYVGLTLATTMKEHITVEFGERDSVYLD